MEPHLVCHGAVFRILQKEAYVILSKKEEKLKLRGRDFRLIAMTGGMRPIGMSS